MEQIVVHSMEELDAKLKEGWLVASIALVRQAPTGAGRIEMTIDDSKVHVVNSKGERRG